MIYGLYSVKDERTDYNAPFQARTDEEAKRNFAAIVNDKNTTVGQFPEDYSLYKVGTFNSENGYIIGMEPELLIRAKEISKNGI